MNRLYVVATHVPRRTTVTVGALGPVEFARGWYAYVGSARRGRDARVARHFRVDKPLRWHADHLFVPVPAQSRPGSSTATSRSATSPVRWRSCLALRASQPASAPATAGVAVTSCGSPAR